ncbi:hypothetical protein Taro_040791 [Colocasia esculenta]|uniref:F-box domain-containing protein n=1 Tax=Colocasia esculenta TaxID=4460 RepID=A0A843WCR2_COLES|nr:hypothetical protein [Colocasia esculenta]
MASPSSTSPSPVQGEDRFGALPESILLLILSFLPTLDAVRTSILSARWRTLWTAIGGLDLDEGSNFFSSTGKRKRWSKSKSSDFLFFTGTRTTGVKRKRKSKDFVDFVGKVLSFHHTPTLHKLRLHCCSQNCPLQDWVRTAVSRGVQMLDLRLPRHPNPDGKAGLLPSLLFTSQSLVDLRLDLGGSALLLPGTLALVGLRRMRLCRVKFYDDHLTRALFSSSTALKSLALEDCDYQKLARLEISCSSLQELAIDSSLKEDGLGSCEVKIAAPHLTSFVYRATLAQAYVVERLARVEYVKIQFQRFGALEGSYHHSILDRTSSLFCSLSSARNLDICPVCVKALRFRRTNDGLCVIPFCNLNVLGTAVKHLNYSALRVVLWILLLNPHLRALVVEVRDMSALPSSAGKEDFLLELVAYCFKLRLGVVEKVEIRYSASTFRSREAVRYTTETVLELVKALLGNQARLRKLILGSRLFCDSFSSNRADAVMEKVLSFPKRTSELAVAFI